MDMKATEVTIQPPSEDAAFLESYAKERSTSVADIFTRYAKRLQSRTPRTPHPANAAFAGSVPPKADARTEYREYIAKKHR